MLATSVADPDPGPPEKEKIGSGSSPRESAYHYQGTNIFMLISPLKGLKLTFMTISSTTTMAVQKTCQ